MRPSRPEPQANPAALLDDWIEAARATELAWPNAMTLATATADGAPSARIVLFKGWSNGRLRFFTNYDSRKGRELEDNPRAALLFYWRSMDRQIRVEGGVEQLSSEESDTYFASRPWASRIAALASEQSRPIASRAELEATHADLAARYDGVAPPRPAGWGGYGLRPDRYEFWVQGPNRLHDRSVYRRSGDGWEFVLLAP